MVDKEQFHNNGINNINGTLDGGDSFTSTFKENEYFMNLE